MSNVFQQDQGGDGDDDARKELTAAQEFREFDCPSCNANNPSEKFTDGDEVLCNYCGTQFDVRISDSGRLKLREK
jgi:transcription elongation factor Elf1